MYSNPSKSAWLGSKYLTPLKEKRNIEDASFRSEQQSSLPPPALQRSCYGLILRVIFVDKVFP